MAGAGEREGVETDQVGADRTARGHGEPGCAPGSRDAGPDPLPPVGEVVARALAAAVPATAPFACATFVCGVRARRLGKLVPQERLDAWKGEVKRALGAALIEAWAGLGRRVDFARPELLVVWDADRGRVEVTARAIWVYGRYRKLDRDLPQTRARWRCPACAGQGCATCAGTGRRHPVALEDLLAGPCARALGAEPDAAVLHGMGREDIDVRCLGPGRPFVVEVPGPRRRDADWAAVAAEVAAGAAGRAELVGPLRIVGDAVVARLKGFEAPKVYQATCRAEAEADLDPARVAALAAALAGRELAQRTPRRVARRRSDLVRRRRVLALDVLAQGPREVVLRIEAESGTYIKELISGDDGRTTPSVSELLGVPTACVALDVLEVRASDAELLGPL